MLLISSIITYLFNQAIILLLIAKTDEEKDARKAFISKTMLGELEDLKGGMYIFHLSYVKYVSHFKDTC